MKYLLKKILFAVIGKFFGKGLTGYKTKYKYVKPKKKKSLKYLITKKIFD